MTVLFPRLKSLPCLKKPGVNRQINLLTIYLPIPPFVVPLCCEPWHGKSFLFSKWNRKEERVAGETFPGKPQKPRQNTLTRNALRLLPSLLCSCRGNFDACKEQPVKNLLVLTLGLPLWSKPETVTINQAVHPLPPYSVALQPPRRTLL